MSIRLILPAIVLSLAAGAVPLAAQRDVVVAGTVRDEAGNPIEDALVVLDASSDRRLTRSDSTGRFRFDRVPVGPHELATAYLRFVTDLRTIDVGADGLEVDITLRRNTALLDTVHVVTQRTGVHGLLIAHEDITPLAGGEVQLLGANLHAKTGADGRFDFPRVRPGGYVVYVKRDGYQSRMLSIVVPRDSAVDLALNVDRSTSQSDKRLEMVLHEFDRRKTWAVHGNAALIPRQELSAHSGQQLGSALRYSMTFLIKGLVVDDSTCVYINGIFQPSLSVDDIPVQGIEAVEVYGTNSDFTGTVTYRHGERPSRLPPRAICGSGSPRSEAAIGLEDLAKQVQTMGPGGKNKLPGARGNPARAEAIVIWVRP